MSNNPITNRQLNISIAGQIALNLDKKDGESNGIITKSVWDNFWQNVDKDDKYKGKKEVAVGEEGINVRDAMKAIMTRIFNAAKTLHKSTDDAKTKEVGNNWYKMLKDENYTPEKIDANTIEALQDEKTPVIQVSTTENTNVETEDPDSNGSASTTVTVTTTATEPTTATIEQTTTLPLVNTTVQETKTELPSVMNWLNTMSAEQQGLFNNNLNNILNSQNNQSNNQLKTKQETTTQTHDDWKIGKQEVDAFNKSAAGQIAMNLDLIDGTQDGQISADTWNKFIDSISKKINKAITQDNMSNYKQNGPIPLKMAANLISTLVTIEASSKQSSNESIEKIMKKAQYNDAHGKTHNFYEGDMDFSQVDAYKGLIQSEEPGDKFLVNNKIIKVTRTCDDNTKKLKSFEFNLRDWGETPIGYKAMPFVLTEYMMGERQIGNLEEVAIKTKDATSNEIQDLQGHLLLKCEKGQNNDEFIVNGIKKTKEEAIDFIRKFIEKQYVNNTSNNLKFVANF